MNHRVDSTQHAIAAAARACGASVLDLSRVGGGCPDLLIGWRGADMLVECKAGAGRVSDRQSEWHREWRGRKVAVVRDAAGMVEELNGESKTKEERK